MTPEKLDSKDQLELAIIGLRSAISGYYSNPNVGDLITSAQTVWTNINSDKTLRFKIDRKIRDMRMALNQMAQLNLSKGDIARRRYDPYKWLANVPEDYKNKTEEFVLGRIQTLLEFLKNLDK